MDLASIINNTAAESTCSLAAQLAPYQPDQQQNHRNPASDPFVFEYAPSYDSLDAMDVDERPFQHALPLFQQLLNSSPDFSVPSTPSDAGTSLLFHGSNSSVAQTSFPRPFLPPLDLSGTSSLSLNSPIPRSPAQSLNSPNPSNTNERLTSSELFERYKNGELDTRAGGNGRWEVQCPKCHNWYASPIVVSRRFERPGHFYNLETHMASRGCRTPRNSPEVVTPLSRRGSFSSDSGRAPKRQMRTPSLSASPSILASPFHMSPDLGSFPNTPSCSCFVNFKYGSADKSTQTSPSRNIPIICPLCPRPAGQNPQYPAVWRYNMAKHIRSRHSEYTLPGSPEGKPLPWEVWKSMEILKEEQDRSGVPESNQIVFTKYEAEPAIPSTSQPSTGRSAKRSRAAKKTQTQ